MNLYYGIVNVNMIRIMLLYITFDLVICDDLCSKVLLLQCGSQYKAAQAEGVCGTNNVSYINFCSYAQAKCKDSTVTIKHVGLCDGRADLDQNKTIILANTTENDTNKLTNDSDYNISMTTASEQFTENKHSITFTKTTPGKFVKATRSAVDFDPIHDLFCAGALGGTIRCTKELDPYCGTNGHFYFNSCEFEKARCHDSHLAKQPLEHCKEKTSTPSWND